MIQNLKILRPMIFLYLLLLSFWTFRYGILGLPRTDHFWFMGEREYAQSDSDFFINVLSFNRTRKNAPGDYPLFRPGTMKDPNLFKNSSERLLFLVILFLLTIVFGLTWGRMGLKEKELIFTF